LKLHSQTTGRNSLIDGELFVELGWFFVASSADAPHDDNQNHQNNHTGQTGSDWDDWDTRGWFGFIGTIGGGFGGCCCRGRAGSNGVYKRIEDPVERSSLCIIVLLRTFSKNLSSGSHYCVAECGVGLSETGIFKHVT